MKSNKHTQAIPAQILQQLHTMFSEAKELVKDYASTLTAQERHNLIKMGPKSLAFVEKALSYAEQNPSLRPGFLDMQMFSADFADAHGLWGIQNLARQLDEAISDTLMEAGSEAYQAALVFYSSVKVAAAQDVPGAKAVYEELRARFPRGRRNSSEQPSEPDAPFE